MSAFKINFKLQELDKIAPFGGEPDLRLHWFGLTDGLLWIDIDKQTIYEYTNEARDYFGSDIRYNDYQISRFIEDFTYTFKFISESIPEELFNIVDKFQEETERWKNSHIDDDDDIFDLFYDNEYIPLTEWFSNRMFDSCHLVGGPYIGCFRCGNNIKIFWESTYKLESGNSIWTSPNGIVTIPYNDFVISVEEFLDSFFAAMDIQVEKAVAKDWQNISLDKERLIEENIERKAGFYKMLSYLKNPAKSDVKETDWDKVIKIYTAMKRL